MRESFPTKTFGSQFGYRLLKRLGLRFRGLRPSNLKGNKEAQAEFIEALPGVVSDLEEKYDTEVRIFTMDEHRMGLKPILRKQWLFPYQRSIKTVMKYDWLWVYGFVEPKTGENHHYLFPSLNSSCFNIALKEFSKDVNASTERPVLLLLDNAGAHTAKNVQRPCGIEFHPFPPYSPELQPAERLWPLMNECIANRLVQTREELEELVSKRCKWMMEKATSIVRNLTLYHWWPSRV